MDTIVSDVANLKGGPISCLNREVDMFSVCGNADKKKMLMGLEEIGKMNANEESMLELGRKLGELENRIEISDGGAMGRLTKGGRH